MRSDQVQSTLHKAAHWFGKDMLAEVRGYAYESESCFTQLLNAVMSGEPRAKKIALDRVLKSNAVKLVALIAEIEAEDNTGSFEQDVLQKLPGMNFLKDCGEPIRTWAEAKDGLSSVGNADVSYRQLCSFGHIRRARDCIVCRILAILFPVHPSNYLSTGRGPHALSAHIKKLGRGKKKHTTRLILADIKNYFPSVRQNQEMVELLGLPECLVRNDIFTPSTAPIVVSGSLPYGVSKEVFIGAARQGVPQGKTTSSIVASILYGRLLENIVPAQRFFFYGDDVGIVCDTTDGETIVDALKAALQGHPSGPFQLKHCGIFNFKIGFNFVGYHYQITSFKDGIRVSPSMQSFRRLETKIAKIVMKFAPARWDEEIACCVEKWLNSFPCWKKSKNGLKKLQGNVAAGKAQGVSLLEMAKKKTAKKKIIIIIKKPPVVPAQLLSLASADNNCTREPLNNSSF